jgi:DNA gyrase subunit A
MIIVDESQQVLTVTENGFGKRTDLTEYRKTNRGGSGIINIKTTERNGTVVALKGVTDRNDIMLITKNGIVIRCDVLRISIIGRNTQGVRLINLDDGDKVVDIALCEKSDEPDPALPAAADSPLAAEAPGAAAAGDSAVPPAPDDPGSTPLHATE